MKPSLTFPSLFLLFVSTLSSPPLQINDEPWEVSSGRGSKVGLGKKSSAFSQLDNGQSRPLETPTGYRLPRSVKPISYKLKLTPIFTDVAGQEKFKAPGEVKIILESSDTSNSLYLHQKNLEIDHDTVELWLLKSNGDQDVKIDIVNHNVDPIRDFYYLDLATPLTNGSKYEINIKFVAPISQTNLNGLYLSYYTEPVSGQIRQLATTQFQATFARQAFPCFDEPDMKATFEISLGRHKDFHSLSNMNILKTDPHDYPEWEWDHYATTVKMSTYLVAMVVSDFASEAADSNIYPGKSVEVYGPPHLIESGGGVFAANASATIINYYQKSFAFEYPLPKLYSIGIPQFSAGAMENFGLNTYRTEYLLHVPGENTEAERKKITQVLSHEISHQWFGDVVTCAWWQYTWLNEGFARFLQYRGMTLVTPEFKTELAIISDATQLGMIFDQGPDSHPINDFVETPEDADNIFSRMTYDKAATILKMVESVVTGPTFDAVLKRYLEKFKYENVVQDDLFQIFQEDASHSLPPDVTFKQILDSWTLAAGYPIVRVTSAASNRIYLSQERFQLNTGPNSKTLRSDGSWYIPVKIVTAAKPDFTSKTPDTWILKDTSVISYDQGIDTSQWIIVNPDLTGYYRVLYDLPLKKLIKDQLVSDHSVISPGTRAQIIEDYFNFALAKYVPYYSALEMTTYLDRETELVVWTAVFANIKNVLAKFTQDTAALELFNKYFMPKFEGALNSVGWDQALNEKGADVILRAQLLDYACVLKNSNCIKKSQDLFALWHQTPTDRTIIPPDIRPVVFCAAVANGDLTIWDQAYERYQAENYTARAHLYKALACSQDQTSLVKFFNLAMTNTTDFQIVTVLQNVAGNSVLGRELVFKYIKDNYPTGSIRPSQFTTVVTTLSTYWNKQTNIDDLRQFMDDNSDTLTEADLASLENSIAKIQGNIDWWNEDGEAIRSWLERASA